ncbi:kelch repeat-containing protein [Parafilimonas sp.]|uniref:kelch repeat-containing protein n=1 Tax=Parafilimonas sp. TaxID=1969739 RepID=UPI0039E5DB69
MSLIFCACTHADITAMEWKLAGELPQAGKGLAGPATGVSNNRLIVAGGSNFPDGMPWLGGKKKYYSEGYIYNKANEDSLVYNKSFSLPFNLAYAASCSTPKGIVVAGGENETGISNKVLLIEINKADSVITTYLPELPFAVTNAAIIYYNNKVYLAGGELSNAVSDKLLMLDLNDTTKGWQSLPHLMHPVSYAVMVTQFNGIDTSIYLIGGRKKNDNGISDLYAYTFEFNLNKNKWSQKQSLPYTLSAGTGVAAGHHNIILFGGDKGIIFHKTEEIIAEINTITDGTKKQQLIEEKKQLQSSHPGFSKAVLAYNTIEDKWTAIDSIPFTAPVTTTAVKWNDMIFIPGGEIKAGVRTPQILSAKMNVK